MLTFIQDDGGREAAGFKGTTGDCVTRAVTIATQQDYQTVYDVLSEGCRTQPLTRRTPRRKPSARNGVNVKRTWFKRYMENLGWIWVPTMKIGSGCTVHLRADELPTGRLIVSVSKHYTTMINGVIHDSYDPSREGTRCVYGYWRQKVEERHPQASNGGKQMKVTPDNPYIFRNSLLTEYHQRYGPCNDKDFVFLKRRWGKGLDRGRSEGNIWLECSECGQVHQLKEIIDWLKNDYRAVPAETVTGDDYPEPKRYQDEPEYKEWLAQMVRAEKEDTPYPKFPFKVGSDA